MRGLKAILLTVLVTPLFFVFATQGKERESSSPSYASVAQAASEAGAASVTEMEMTVSSDEVGDDGVEDGRSVEGDRVVDACDHGANDSKGHSEELGTAALTDPASGTEKTGQAGHINDGMRVV